MIELAPDYGRSYKDSMFAIANSVGNRMISEDTGNI